MSNVSKYSLVLCYKMCHVDNLKRRVARKMTFFKTNLKVKVRQKS